MFGSKHERLKKRLTAVREEISRLRRRAGVLDEQVVFLRQVESDAATEAVVHDDHVTGREHATARSDLRRTEREASEVRARIAALVAEQDNLLEQLLG